MNLSKWKWAGAGALSAWMSVVTGLPAAPAAPPAETREQREARMKWWTEARFGMFIHWDMSSLAGTEISWSRKGSKPLDITGDPAGYVEDPVYDHLYQKFDPQKFNAAEWVRLARAAGMKYLVFTAKHHGGFCMWDTRFTDYSIRHTPFQRDVVKELAEACHQAGIHFGLYYSQRDWHHPDYGVGDNRKYHEYLQGQLTELLTHYGPVDVMWFDSFGKGDSIQYWHADEIVALVKRLQPQAIINNRSGFFGQSVEALRGDHDTPEQRLGEFQNTRPWESCMTVVHCADGGGWSYRPDGRLRSLEECIRSLVSCATGDGNLLLDVGPNALGEIPADQAGRLMQMGEWLKTYGPSIYGTRGGPFRNGRWGGSTCRGNTVYLHVLKWNGDTLELPALQNKIVRCASLANPEVRPALDQDAQTITLKLAPDLQDKIDTVLALELAGPAESEFKNGQPLAVSAGGAGAVVKQAADGSLTLAAETAVIKGGTARLEDRGGGPNIGYWTDARDSVSWRASIQNPGTFAVDLTYACQPDAAGSSYTVTAGDQTIQGKVEGTSSFDDYRTVRVGTLKIEKAGPLTVVLQPTSKPGGAVMNLRQLKLVAH